MASGSVRVAKVTAHKEIAVLQPSTLRRQSVLLDPQVDSLVLDLLYNYTHARWRGGIGRGNLLWGISAVEATIAAVQLWRGMRACSAVCQAWQAALLPFGSLKKMCHHAWQMPPTSLKLPCLPEAVGAIIHAGVCWQNALNVVPCPDFIGNTWPCQVSGVYLESEMSPDEYDYLDGPTPKLLHQHANSLSKAAQHMLHGLPLAWRTKLDACGETEEGDGTRFATCDLLEFTASDREHETAACFVCKDEGGHMRLVLCDGRQLLPPDLLSPLTMLEESGLQAVSVGRSWSSGSIRERSPGEPCPFCRPPSPCRRCDSDREGRNRLGASQLNGSYSIEFLAGEKKITLDFQVKVLPFLATSKDPDLIPLLRSLVPWDTEHTEMSVEARHAGFSDVTGMSSEGDGEDLEAVAALEDLAEEEEAEEQEDDEEEDGD